MTLYELLPTRRNRRPSQPAKHSEVDPFAYLQRRANHLFEDFFRDSAIEPSGGFGGFSQGFVPSVDIKETDKDLLISAELPGVDEKDVEIFLDQEKAAAEFKKGILTITLPKVVRGKPEARKIEIKSK